MSITMIYHAMSPTVLYIRLLSLMAWYRHVYYNKIKEKQPPYDDHV